MRKIILIALVIMMTLTLGCGNNSENGGSSGIKIMEGAQTDTPAPRHVGADDKVADVITPAPKGAVVPGNTASGDVIPTPPSDGIPGNTAAGGMGSDEGGIPSNVAPEDLDLSQRAVESGDPSLCENIQDRATRDSCYSNLALDLVDSSLCDKILESAEADSCYWNLAVVRGEGSGLCSNIVEQKTRDSCYKNIALEKKDSSLCNKIEDEAEKQGCKDNV